MAQIKAAIAGLHLPTLVLAILVAVGAGVTVNGQPVDLTTGSGRTAAALGLLFLVFGAIGKFYAANPVVSLPAGLTPAEVNALIADALARFEAATVATAAAAPSQPIGTAPNAPSDTSLVSVAPTSPWGKQNNLPGV